MNPGDLDKPAVNAETTVIAQILAQEWLVDLMQDQAARDYVNGDRGLPLKGQVETNVGKLTLSATRVWWAWCKKEGVA